MEKEKVIYSSAGNQTEEQSALYTQTHQAPHRYLAYKDIPMIIRQFVKGKKALDYGAGTGASSSFLHNLGFDVIGMDISSSMLEKARMSFPDIEFYNFQSQGFANSFDLVFSSFVLFEISSINDIVQYLNRAFSFLKNGGIFVGITGSEHLYAPFRNWTTFDANFAENKELRSGDIARLLLKHPRMEFSDYYWKETDYTYCFEKSGLEILQIHHPLGSIGDPQSWKDELSYSPFTIFVAKKPDI